MKKLFQKNTDKFNFSNRSVRKGEYEPALS